MMEALAELPDYVAQTGPAVIASIRFYVMMMCVAKCERRSSSPLVVERIAADLVKSVRRVQFVSTIISVSGFLKNS